MLLRCWHVLPAFFRDLNRPILRQHPRRAKRIEDLRRRVSTASVAVPRRIHRVYIHEDESAGLEARRLLANERTKIDSAPILVAVHEEDGDEIEEALNMEGSRITDEPCCPIGRPDSVGSIKETRDRGG